MALFFGEDRQIARREAEDGEAERDEHGRDDDLGPLRCIAATHRVLDSGDGNVQTIGNESQQGEDGRQVKPLRAVADLWEQPAAPSGNTTDSAISSRKNPCS